MEAELAEERRRRQVAEDAIADIRRECRAPFVVPSLLDAFMELSRMTTIATTNPGSLAPQPSSTISNNKHPPQNTTTTNATVVLNGSVQRIVLSMWYPPAVLCHRPEAQIRMRRRMLHG
ncbi:hypothetical protein BJ912DRAFT_249482 [Pholiota molesta]|nr:hypothetical protein BJ912DRAFT_249482 [Pholiota molesta]